MNKIDASLSSLTLSPASIVDLNPGRRLIVLVSESDMDTGNAAQRIWELANALESRVQFIGLCKDATREPALRRKLINLSAIIGNGNVSVHSKIEFGSNWLNLVRANWRAGDVIACFAEQRAGFMNRPLSQLLEAKFNTKVQVLSGFQSIEKPQPNWLTSAVAWIGSIVVVAGFFIGQVKIIQLPPDWAHTFLLYASIFVEVGILWAWNLIF